MNIDRLNQIIAGLERHGANINSILIYLETIEAYYQDEGNKEALNSIQTKRNQLRLEKALLLSSE